MGTLGFSFQGTGILLIAWMFHVCLWMEETGWEADTCVQTTLCQVMIKYSLVVYLVAMARNLITLKIRAS